MLVGIDKSCIKELCYFFRFQNLGEMMTLGTNDAAITASFIEGLTLEGPVGHAGMDPCCQLFGLFLA
jgi:hypothetical protein